MDNIFNAQFIRQNEDLGTVCPVFRKIFWADKKVRKATLSVSALGFYEVHINNQKIGKFVFAPGWTSYETRLQYQTYNVTKYLEECNTIVIAVGVVLMVPLQPVLQNPVLLPAFNNVVPALFGALGLKYFIKSPQIAVVPLVLMSALYIFVPSLISQTSLMLLPSGALALGLGFLLFKKGKLK